MALSSSDIFEAVRFAPGRPLSFSGSVIGATPTRLELGLSSLGHLGGLARPSSGLRRPQGETLEVSLAQVGRADRITASGIKKLLVECGASRRSPGGAICGPSPRLVGSDSTGKSSFLVVQRTYSSYEEIR